MFFLKYRPQTIAELDLEDVRDWLGKILKGNKIPQAFLFSGPKGLGKTSAARILAKAVNCLKPKESEPCNHCRLCRQINSGNSLDVLEIDAASNRGIDDIRQLKEKIGLSPMSGRYKIYIIDEVHMLTKEAFNALLKTLEEPPPHVIFILCTTDPEKIIPTVLSRLIRIDFKKGSEKEIIGSLEKVISGERLSVDRKVVKAIVGLADGSFRDAQKILEGLVLSLGRKISWKESKKQLNYWQKQRPEAVLVALSEGNVKEVLEAGEILASNGADFSDYLYKILDLVRNIILVKAGVKQETDLEKLATSFTFNELTKISRVFSRAVIEQKSTVLSQLPFQLAVTELVKSGKLPQGGTSEPIRVSSRSKSETVSSDKVSSREAKVDREESQKINRQTEADLTSIESVSDNWAKLLQVIRPMNHSVAAFLRSSRPKMIDGGKTVILEVFYKFHKDKLEQESNRRIVEDGLKKVCGKSLNIKCVLGEKRQVADGIEKVTSKKALGEATKEDQRGKGKDDDLYQIAKEIFGN